MAGTQRRHLRAVGRDIFEFEVDLVTADPADPRYIYRSRGRGRGDNLQFRCDGAMVEELQRIVAKSDLWNTPGEALRHALFLFIRWWTEYGEQIESGKAWELYLDEMKIQSVLNQTERIGHMIEDVKRGYAVAKETDDTQTLIVLKRHAGEILAAYHTTPAQREVLEVVVEGKQPGYGWSTAGESKR